MSEPDELSRLRAVIDGVDDRLVALLAERAAAVRELWAWKAKHGVAQRDPAREAELRQRLLLKADALGLDRAAVERVLSTIVGHALSR
jgi:chorismate mutase